MSSEALYGNAPRPQETTCPATSDQEQIESTERPSHVNVSMAVVILKYGFEEVKTLLFPLFSLCQVTASVVLSKPCTVPCRNAETSLPAKGPSMF